MEKILIDPGTKFGRLTVLECFIRDKQVYCKCLCSCGSEFLVRGISLRRGDTKSCGCLSHNIEQSRRTSEIGNIYGKLLVIEVVDDGCRETISWSCLCDCGNTVIVRGASLRSGHTRSCGCLQKEVTIKRLTLEQGESGFRLFLYNLKRNAKVRGIKISLSNDQIRELTQKDCFYCGRPPSQIIKNHRPDATKYTRKHSTYIYNGIDRFNNELGYTPKNSVPCCKFCNRAKMDMSPDIFKKLINGIYHHWILGKVKDHD